MTQDRWVDRAWGCQASMTLELGLALELGLGSNQLLAASGPSATSTTSVSDSSRFGSFCAIGRHAAATTAGMLQYVPSQPRPLF